VNKGGKAMLKRSHLDLRFAQNQLLAAGVQQRVQSSRDESRPSGPAAAAGRVAATRGARPVTTPSRSHA
jgi:hypothetical protein